MKQTLKKILEELYLAGYRADDLDYAVKQAMKEIKKLKKRKEKSNV